MQRDKSWEALAECAKVIREEPELANAWTDESTKDKEYARFICTEQCPVRDLCLRDAVADPEATGIRAGFEFTSGGLLKKERQRLKEAFPLMRARVRHQNMNSEAS